MIWKRPKQYGLVDKAELKKCGLTDIKKLLKLDDEQQIFTCCNDDVNNETLFKQIYGDLIVDGKIIKETSKDVLLEFREIIFVASNYEGGMCSISFSFKDLIKVKKQVLFDKLN